MGQAKEIFENSVMGLAGSAAGAIGNELAYSIGELTGGNKRRANAQYEQQKRLTEMQAGYNEQLMEKSYDLQQQMWNDTNYEAQIEHAKAAGLNPAMLYAKGGSGGSTGSGGTSIGGAQASDETSRLQAETAQQGMGLQLAMMQSQIEVNKSIAAKNNAEATKAGEETTTITSQRDLLTEKIKQEGKSSWLQNIRTEWENNTREENGITVYKNKQYGEGGVSQGSLFDQQATNEVIKIMSEVGVLNETEKLTNQKVVGYVQELMNETAKANAAGVQAAAQKLSAEWTTGEYTNWKTWAELGKTVVNLIVGAIK